MDSEQGVLPGDHVPGIADADETHVFTTADRDALSVALQKRLSANEKRGKAFDAEFPPLVIHPWTAYTREATKESMEQGGWSLWGKMLGFGLRAALLLLFPEEALVEGIGHAATAVLEGAAEFGLEQGQEAAQEASKESQQEAVEERDEDRFHEQEEAVSKLISESLGTVLQLVAEGRQYEHWLRDAPLSELGLFRIPLLIPDIAESKARIHARVAESMAAIVHDAASVGVTRVPGHPHEASSLNTIIVDLHVDAPRAVHVHSRRQGRLPGRQSLQRADHRPEVLAFAGPADRCQGPGRPEGADGEAGGEPCREGASGASHGRRNS